MYTQNGRSIIHWMCLSISTIFFWSRIFVCDFWCFFVENVADWYYSQDHSFLSTIPLAFYTVDGCKSLAKMRFYKGKCVEMCVLSIYSK